VSAPFTGNTAWSTMLHEHRDAVRPRHTGPTRYAEAREADKLLYPLCPARAGSPRRPHRNIAMSTHCSRRRGHELAAGALACETTTPTMGWSPGPLPSVRATKSGCLRALRMVSQARFAPG
jgi:hypothetical protein